LFFALGCAAEKEKDYRASIHYFAQAQAIKALRHPYDSGAVRAFHDRCEAVFGRRRVATAPGSSPGEPIPVFVIGMPRSGTTLTEQILTSHSQVEGAGEVGYMNELARYASKKSGRPFPDCADAIGCELMKELRGLYFSRMHDRCAESAFVVDKNPLNFNFTGLISTVFPEAKLLYCLRDPVDNCVSIFRLPFDDNQGYSHDLASLGHYYRSHEKLMEMWHRLYPKMILTVRYEDTVADLECQARRMLAFLGLPFEEGVLRYHENQRAVLTPSTEQVRQRIYTTSVNYEARYGSALAPLKRALES
jgi:hypothetical protein